MIQPPKKVFQNIKMKMNSRTWMTLKSSVGIFQALKLLHPHCPHRPLQPHWPLQPQKPYFTKKTSWSWWLDYPWHQNDQCWPLFLEWIIKNPIFHWYLILFLSEAVGASWCHFSEMSNPPEPTMHHHQIKLLILLPPETFTLDHSQMRHPVERGYTSPNRDKKSPKRKVKKAVSKTMM